MLLNLLQNYKKYCFQQNKTTFSFCLYSLFRQICLFHLSIYIIILIVAVASVLSAALHGAPAGTVEEEDTEGGRADEDGFQRCD